MSNDTILVIGYGNELRGDDGIGPRVVEAIGTAKYPGVQTRTVFQLLPELAAELVEVGMVIFVDALDDPRRIVVELVPVEAEGITDWSTHRADPRTLLALAHVIYGRTPEAWSLMVPGQNFDFSEELSPMAQENVRLAIAHIDRLIQTSHSFGE
jgi:hydrogenase maturation protease